MRAPLAALILLLAGLLAAPLVAQEAAPEATEEPAPVETAPDITTIRSPVLTIDPDRLFAASAFGQRLTRELARESEALAAENRAIEAALTEEERALTEQRATMEQEAFRAAADAFDQKVIGIRRAQDAKERALGQQQAEGQDQFRQEIQPILGRLMLERGAVVVLDRRSAFLSIGVIDITEEAIAAIDAELGSGEAAE